MPTTAPTHAEIAVRAYDIYLKTGRRHGQCTRNWFLAERSLREQATRSAAHRGAEESAAHHAKSR